MKLDKEDPAESVGNPVTLDFGCWLSFSESAKTRKFLLRIQHVNTLLLGALSIDVCCQTLKMPTRLTDCLMEPDNLAKLLAKTGLLSATLNQVLCKTELFFPWLFVWLCCHLCQQLVEAENLPCLSVFDAMLTYCFRSLYRNRRRSISFCEQLLANSYKKPLGNCAGLRWNPRHECMMLLHSVFVV